MWDIIFYLLFVILPIYFGTYRNLIVGDYRAMVISHYGMQWYNKMPHYYVMVFSPVRFTSKRLKTCTKDKTIY